jgi:transcriptional regulator with XRE-family HTH domain
MDMQIDSEIVKAERQRRGWSQEQLAATTGLGVRTIQRIESTGTSSAESSKALSAVLELPLARLVAKQTLHGRTFRHRALLACTATALAVIGSAGFLVSRADATEVAMSIVLDSETSGVSTMNIASEDGKPTEIKLEGDLRLVLVPKRIEGDRVLLSVDFYVFEDNEYKLRASPKILMQEGIAASISMDSGHGKPVSLSVTPKKH